LQLGGCIEASSTLAPSSCPTPRQGMCGMLYNYNAMSKDGRNVMCAAACPIAPYFKWLNHNQPMHLTLPVLSPSDLRNDCHIRTGTCGCWVSYTFVEGHAYACHLEMSSWRAHTMPSGTPTCVDDVDAPRMSSGTVQTQTRESHPRHAHRLFDEQCSQTVTVSTDCKRDPASQWH
jgi:hypothetical protein